MEELHSNAMAAFQNSFRQKLLQGLAHRVNQRNQQPGECGVTAFGGAAEEEAAPSTSRREEEFREKWG